MSVDLEPRTRPLPELDAEQEVDFGRYFRAIAARWWLLLVGLVAGALIGYLATLGGGKHYRATARVYLGQPFAPGGAGNPIIPSPTQLGLITNLLTSDATIRRVAAKVGMRTSNLDHNLSTKPLVGITGAKLGTPAPLLEVTVKGPQAAKVAAAANELAKAAVAEASKYTDAKLSTLNAKLLRARRELAKVTARIDQATAQQQRVFRNPALSSVEKLIFIANLNNVLTFNEQRRANLELDTLSIPQLIALADDVEVARVLSPAVAVRESGPSRRTGLAIGAFIGLLLGIVATLVWEPVATRLRAQRE